MISIHALREEGDAYKVPAGFHHPLFLSTPSARRATGLGDKWFKDNQISIHALREEGDPRLDVVVPDPADISIHALREEGDSKNRDKISIFKQIIQHSARI